ncbi:MAG TPA: metalloregulator ArsR/SmtB family transcription factor [Acidimicrobiia bacterium]|nr:metalloregulator ArsR/SmtB family transcription factor [Acidimicrobiia bacterium]
MVLSVAPDDAETEGPRDPERTAEVLAALASPHRLEVVALLAEGDLPVSEVARRLGLSVANASHHLARLRRPGLVATRREGTRVVCRLVPTEVLEVCSALSRLADRASDP